MTTDVAPRVGAFAARLTHVRVGRDLIALWQVDDLESHVDRDALLRADDAPEPPYWAHLWSGSRLLAAAVPERAGRVLELGCGLGLPAIVAARRGAQVLATDREAAPLAFVRASAATNGVETVRVAALDLRGAAFARRFDLVLLAEVLYDRSGFAAIVETIDRVLAPAGAVLISDARRIDTRDFYVQLETAGLACAGAEWLTVEESAPVRIRLVRVTRRGR